MAKKVAASKPKKPGTTKPGLPIPTAGSGCGKPGKVIPTRDCGKPGPPIPTGGCGKGPKKS